MRNYIISSVAVLIAVFGAYGTMLLALDNKVFEAQANMVTQDQLRFELEQSNDRIENRLNGIDAMLLLLLERDYDI